ncbi:17-beta-hydroxysteroid dehydrogenase 13-like [Contarinia nasturtii]|uniref:17-beta-hydroxysteroid dehydrogenase 13-like n=1 Tax=Contarinia nasturtii TaxID=265458 RepID=UPI0012D3E4F6|nr:17-beta-hydroxysteroid dehydrogenase 13-like [Contarinia nasturtii]
MDDLYSFGKTKYIPADPINRSIFRIVKNVLLVFFAALKCTVLGVFIIIKAIILFVIPKFAKDIQNQVALVTGGANGIGRAICIELAKCGCNVAVADVDLDGALDTVEELHLLGVKAFAYEVDVANFEEIVVLKEKIAVDLGEVDILVNNAGLLPRLSLLQCNPEDILRIIKVNLVSYFWTIRVFVPSMIERNSGHIVSIDSIMGQESTCRAITYSSTKFGIRGLMDGLYDLIRLDNLNLNVTTIFPTLTNTRKEFIESFISHGGLNPASELTFYTPQEVANCAIDGILKNKQYVSIPQFMKHMITFLNLLPEELQNLIRDNFKPNVGPGVNESKLATPPPYMNGTK